MRRSGRLDLRSLVEAGAGPALDAKIVADLELEPPLEVPDGLGVLRCTDPSWPHALRGMATAPGVLFYQGSLAALGRPAVALVGTRQASQRGRDFASMLAARVRGRGGVVVSGMAQGIDVASHEAAAASIAVLGQGLATRFTGWRARTMALILERGGLVLSEFPPGMPAHPYMFIQRNRIIAALAGATVVVEAGTGSGALHTAAAARQLGRRLFAVPGHPTDPGHEGCNALLRGGAEPLLAPDDLDGLLGPPLEGGAQVQPESRGFTGGEQSFEELLASTGLDAVALVRRLGELELEGQVRRTTRDRWVWLRP